MNRIGMASTLRSVFNKKRRRKAGFARHRQSSADYKIEPLEQRRVLAVDFVSAAVVDGEPFFTVQADQGLIADAGTLTESPQQVILQFTPGAEIDPASLSGISIIRSGGRGDGFEADGEGSLSDIAVSPGVLVVDDIPASNQVVIRFQETLPDDSYRFTISSTSLALVACADAAPGGGQAAVGPRGHEWRTGGAQQQRARGQQPRHVLGLVRRQRGTWMVAERGLLVSRESSPQLSPAVRVRTCFISPESSVTITSHVPSLMM